MTAAEIETWQIPAAVTAGGNPSRDEGRAEVNYSTPAQFHIPKIAELIATTIRADIASGALKTGDQIPTEIEMTDRFRVSRPTAREAMRILEVAGLILTRRGSQGGAFVQAPTVIPLARQLGVHLDRCGVDREEIGQAAAHLRGIQAKGNLVLAVFGEVLAELAGVQGARSEPAVTS